MKIYDDIALIEQAIDGLIDSHDVFDGETEQALHNLMAARQETIENGMGTLCKLRVHKQTELDGIKAEIARLTLAKKRQSELLSCQRVPAQASIWKTVLTIANTCAKRLPASQIRLRLKRP